LDRHGCEKSGLDITDSGFDKMRLGGWTGSGLRGTLAPGNLRRWGITDGWLTATRAIINFSFAFSFPSRRLMERTIPRSINRHRRLKRFWFAGLRHMPSPWFIVLGRATMACRSPA
jgi:hypothetical protein